MQTLLRMFLFSMLLMVSTAGFAQTATLNVTVNEYGSTGSVANIKVTAIDFSNGSNKTSVNTNSSGLASFTLKQGAYYIEMTKQDGSLVYYPNSTTIGASTYVSLTSGTVNNVSMNYLSGRPPILTIWPGNGSDTTIGNPSTVSITVDNGVRSLSELDGTSFKASFDSLDVTAVIAFGLPASSFITSGNIMTVNIPHVALPAGKHTFSITLGNKGVTANTISQAFTIQNSKGFEIGFHTPPFEDYIAPLTDWQTELSRVNTAVNRKHTLVGYFMSWADTSGNYNVFNTFLNNQIVATGAIPVITWEPWAQGGGTNQPNYTLTALISGKHDAYIKAYAQSTKAFGKPVILRLMHEFNGVYYPWAGPNNNNDPSLFKQAFSYVVNLFRGEGAYNAEFMWSPNYAADSRVPAAVRDINLYYPGNDVVSWIGVSGYNWGADTRMQAQGWLNFRDIYDSSTFDYFLTTMAKNYPSKKVIIAEIGSNTGTGQYSKAAWITDAYANMATYGNVGGAVWFNNTAIHDAANIEADFRVISAPGASTTLGKSAVDTTVTEAYFNAVRSE